MLILGTDLAAFLQAAGRKINGPVSLGKSTASVAVPRKLPAGDMADYQPITEKLGNLIGICPDCELMIYRRVSLAKLEQVRGKMNVTFSEAQGQVSETSEPTVNSDLK